MTAVAVLPWKHLEPTVEKPEPEKPEPKTLKEIIEEEKRPFDDCIAALTK